MALLASRLQNGRYVFGKCDWFRRRDRIGFVGYFRRRHAARQRCESATGEDPEP